MRRLLIITLATGIVWMPACQKDETKQGTAASAAVPCGDDAIANDIKSKMFSDPELKRANINVAVKDGEATLSGAVPNSALQLKAYKLAESAPGVKKVNDQMNVGAAHAARATPAPAGTRPATTQRLPLGEQPVSMVLPAGTTLSV